jgi:thioredoxin reductase
MSGGEQVVARRLLLAYGLRDVWPDIPGLARVYGSNAHVCPDCDGYEARGKKVVVIGTGRRAVGMALNLTTWTDRIIVCTNGKPPELDDEYCARLDALNIPVLTDPVRRVCYLGTAISCLELENGMQLDAEKIFFSLAQYPSDDLGAQLQCERDEGGHIIVDEHLHTSVRNVFAAGDLVPGAQLAIAAAADGAIAALAMHKSLVPASRKLEPLTHAAAH